MSKPNNNKPAARKPKPAWATHEGPARTPGGAFLLFRGKADRFTAEKQERRGRCRGGARTGGDDRPGRAATPVRRAPGHAHRAAYVLLGVMGRDSGGRADERRPSA